MSADMERPGVQVRWGVKVPLRDGIRLNATLYLPVEHTGPAPVVFTLTPYVGQNYHHEGMYFAQQGYPFLTVDVRGRGNSEGAFRPLINEAKDGHDIVEWLAQQPYCDGHVAMWGGSYGGFVQWAAARERPRHLSTIVPTASAYIGVDFPLRGNIAAPYWIRWLTLVSGHTSQEKIFADEPLWSGQFRRWFESGTPFEELDAFVGNPSASFKEWVAHPHQGSYWDAYNPTAAEYARLSIPILTITGAYDADQPGALAYYREHLRHCAPAERKRHYLVIGPWNHAGTRTPVAEFCGLKVGAAALLDLLQLHCEWYAWTLQGGPKPEFLQKNVAYYVMGAERWRYADSLEAVTARHEPFYLHSSGDCADVFNSGALSAEAPARSQPDDYVYDPRDVSDAELESQVGPEHYADQRMIHARIGKQLVYHSALFKADMELSGFFKLSVWLSIDQPDTDFRAAVYEIGVDGSAIQLTFDAMRARYRESLREPKLISSTAPLRYDFTGFTFVSRQVKRGSRLRLVIGPINSIYSQKNYNSGGVVAEESMRDSRAVTVRLHHDPEHPSALSIPIGQPDSRG